MTVRELIERLKDMPPESKIVAREIDGGFFEVKPQDLYVQKRAYFPIGTGKYGYWEMADGSEGQGPSTMVVVVAP